MLDMEKKRIWPYLLAFIIGVVLMFGIFQVLIPKTQAGKFTTQLSTAKKNQKTTIHLEAFGDSLTAGVGDEQKQGGFVPMLAVALKEKNQIKTMTTTNDGVSGNRSDQLLKRLQTDKQVQANIRQADLITLTVGGNDLLKVIRENWNKEMTVEAFKEQQAAYQKQLKALYQALRQLNKEAPIYQIGIYNPFASLTAVAAMNTVVSNWNKASQTIVEAEQNSYFIPIRSAVESTSSTASQDTSAATEESSYLSDEDQFHPNNQGYQRMNRLIVKVVQQTKSQWLSKE